MTLSPLSFRKRYIPSCETPTPSSSPLVASPALPPRKRYQATSELIADTKSEDLEDESTNSKSEEVASEDRQLSVLVGGTTTNEPLGLGYEAARRHALELAEDTTRSTFEVGQSSRSIPDQHVAYLTPRLSVRPTWVDPEDAFLTIPSPVPTPVTTLVAIITVDGDEFLEVGAQLDLHRSILHDHTQRLDALLPTLIKGFRRDITELLDRSGAVRDEIHSQCFRLRSLKQGQERATITFGAMWKRVLALEAWARQSDAQRHELQELRHRVTTLEQEKSRRVE
ncbi:hypothetical protein Tco_1438203 [Tanacetum coccineum]